MKQHFFLFSRHVKQSCILMQVDFRSGLCSFLSDGVLSLTRYQNIEVWLLETSKAMKKAGKSKISFDHHKRMFGLLAIMKRLAHHYELASYETLSNVKIFFLHAHGMFPEYDACIDLTNALHRWCYPCVVPFDSSKRCICHEQRDESRNTNQLFKAR